MARASSGDTVDRRTLAALRVLGLSTDVLRPSTDAGAKEAVERVQLAYRQTLRRNHPDKLPAARHTPVAVQTPLQQAQRAQQQAQQAQQAQLPQQAQQAQQAEKEGVLVPSVDRIRQARKHLLKTLGHGSAARFGAVSGSSGGSDDGSDSDAGVADVADTRTAYTEVDLDDFDYHPAPDATADSGGGTYTLPCRCGCAHKVTDDDLDNGVELVECDGCSLVVRLLYEAA